MGLHKVTALMMCLCKLYNFVVDEKTTPALYQNAVYGMVCGSVPLKRHNNFNKAVPEQLWNRGDH